MAGLQSWAEAKSQSDEVEFRHQTEGDDDGDPQYCDDDGPTIQVLFGDARGTRILGEAAAEHIGQTATLTLVHKNQQGEQEAENNKNNLQHKLDDGHSGHE